MASPIQDDDAAGGWVQFAQLVLQAVGAGAALFGWIAVVGASLTYIRFERLGIPSPLNTAAALPREVLFATGMRAMLAPVAIGLLVAATAWVIGRASELSWARLESRKGRHAPFLDEDSKRFQQLRLDRDVRRDKRALRTVEWPATPNMRRGKAASARARVNLWTSVLAVPLVLAGLVSWLIYPLLPLLLVIIPAVVVLFAVVVFSISSYRVTAVAGFALVVLLGGCMQLALARILDFRLERAGVARKGGGGAEGFYLARAGGDVYLAKQIRDTYTIVMVPEDDVSELQIGPSVALKPADKKTREPKGPAEIKVNVDGTTVTVQAPPTLPPASTAPGPRVDLPSLDTIRVSKGNPFLVSIGRFREDVTGLVSMTTRSRNVRLATKPFQAAANGTAAVRIRLSATGQGMLQRRGRLPVRVFVSARGESGAAASARDDDVVLTDAERRP